MSLFSAACPGSDAKWEDGSANNALTFHNFETVANVTSFDDCKSLCLSNLNLPCRSIDFDINNSECHMSKTTQKTLLDYYLPVDGFSYAEWICLDGKDNNINMSNTIF